MGPAALQVSPLLEMLMGVHVQVLVALLPTQISANVSWEAGDDGIRLGP